MEFVFLEGLQYPKRSDTDKELNFRKRLKILIGKTLKVFLHSPPPLERESFIIRIVESTIHQICLLSIQISDKGRKFYLGDFKEEVTKTMSA
jgi:hypothetical protein